MKKKVNKNFVTAVIIVFLVTFYFLNERRNKRIDADIIDNKHETVAKFYDVEYRLRKRWALYMYNFNGMIYKGKINSYKPYSSPQDLLGKFFVVDVHSKNPERDIIYLDREVTDSLEIARSGL
jgi:hypothetical protein